VAYRLVVGSAVFFEEAGGDGAIAHDVPIAREPGRSDATSTFPSASATWNPLADSLDEGLAGAAR